MALYQYNCIACSETHMKLVSISNADEIQYCPKCGCDCHRDETPTNPAFKIKGFSYSNGYSNGPGPDDL